MVHKYIQTKLLLSLFLVFFLFSLPTGSLAQDPFATDSEISEFGDDQNESDEFSATFDTENDDGDEKLKGLVFTGFVEIEQGGHIGEESAVDEQWVMSNRRFRLESQANNEMGSIFLKADLIDDSIFDETYIDLREARIVVTPVEQIDLSVGKQVNTWGVGDMLFINDLFPKNWVSNFLGRDMESMKDSANSFRITGYLGDFIVDVVYHPEFAPDTTPTGCRLSVYDPNTQSLVSNSSSCDSQHEYFDQPEDDTSETAARIKMQAGSFELALYAYKGFFKNPKGMQWADTNGNGTGETDLVDGQQAGYTTLISYYPRLQVQGFSVEGQLGPGIVSLETGKYQSMEDEDGDNPLIENSKWKYLIGYRMDVSANFSAGVQWYQEQMLQYDRYETSMETYFPQIADYKKKERQNTYTLRLTIKAQQETLWINLFHYERPEDKDRFTKLDISKRLNDNLEAVFGINLFDGEDHYEDRDFGMLKNDDNLFARLKYNF
jgi:hypothetical protein